MKAILHILSLCALVTLLVKNGFNKLYIRVSATR